MITQRVVWTLLPNGINKKSKRARASVLVSPRLMLPNTTQPADLSHFDYWQDWPAIIQAASFKISINGGAQVVDAALTSKPDSAIWKAIFPVTTFVKPWQFDEAGLRNKVILSYPVAAVSNLIEDLYGQIGIAAQAGLPDRRNLAGVIAGLQTDNSFLAVAGGDGVRPKPLTPEEVLDRLRRESKRQDLKRPAGNNPKAGANQGLMGDPAQALDLLQAYHTPLEAVKTGQYAANQKPDNYGAKFPNKPNPFRHAKWKTRDKSPLPDAQDYKDHIDFHQISASLCQYPEINRLCGLVLDLEFDRPNTMGATATLELKADWQTLAQPGPAATEPDINPKIIVNSSKSVFYAARKNTSSPIIERYLNLSGEDFSLVQMDVDGAGMKLKNLRESLKRDVPIVYDDDTFEQETKPEAGLPSLRTSGVMLAENRRDLSVTALLQRAGAMQSALASSSQAPTLYAEDIIRGFRVDVLDDKSNKWRSIFYRQTNFKFTNTGGDHITPKEEGMARIAAGGSTDNTNADIVKIHEALVSWTGWSLAAPEPGRLVKKDDSVGDDNEQTPPGLPLETKYSVVPDTLPRLRFGNTYRMRVRLVDLAGASEDHSEANIHPKGAASMPMMLRRHEPIEPPALALVSAGGTIDPLGDGESMQHIAIRSWNDTPDKNVVAATQTSRRHVTPTRVSHRFAELHGAMDTGSGGAIDKSIYAMLVAQDKALPEISLDRGKNAATNAPERYTFADEKFKLPYLPDPLAISVAIRVIGADGVNPDIIHKVPLYCSGAAPDCSWPNALAFKIIVAESAIADATFNATTREFHIPMKKAERARVYLSCLMPKDAMAMMAVRQMIMKRNPDANTRQEIEKRIANGQHWMFTPWRIVEIVHAVQKPLIAPVITNLNINRKLGDTAATPGIESLPLHSKSTARVDMKGEWREPVDDPADLQAAEGPYTVALKAHAFSKKIARNDAPNGVYNYFTGKHNFANTHYRRVQYKLDAMTRYKEFFEEPIRIDEQKQKVTSPVRTGWAPNSAPPPPPSILYVVPTFGWVRTNKGGRASSLRAGGGLRVYLDRPWMTTGFTEMLGVVLAHKSNTKPVSNATIDADYTGSVTMWGADPIWANPAKIADASPPLSAFPLARLQGPITFEGSGLPEEEGTDLPPGGFFHTRLPHPEIMDDTAPSADQTRLDVAPHVTGYDPERKLWYCDIVIRPPAGTYYPFVRLALARYNPISTWRAHLSAMVMTEFQQLTPDRLVIATKDGSARKAHVAVYGVAGKPSLSQLDAGRYEAITQVLSAGADPELGWRTVKAAAPASPQLSARLARRGVVRAAPQSTQLKRQAEQALQAENLNALIAKPELILALRPPLLWETDIWLPDAPAGGKRRILVTEKEHYRIEADDLWSQPGAAISSQTLPKASRVVYMEVLDV